MEVVVQQKTLLDLFPRKNNAHSSSESQKEVIESNASTEPQEVAPSASEGEVSTSAVVEKLRLGKNPLSCDSNVELHTLLRAQLV